MTEALDESVESPDCAPDFELLFADLSTRFIDLPAGGVDREIEEVLRLAIDAAQAGLWTLDLETGVFWGTPRARAMFGCSPGDVITLQRLESSVRPDDWPAVRDAMQRSLESRGCNSSHRTVACRS